MSAIRSDSRYTVAKEFCGHSKARWVVRFCGEFVESFQFHGAALMRAAGEAAKRRGCLVIKAVEKGGMK